MSPDPQDWCQAVEDPEGLSAAAWARLETALAADVALRRRLVLERRLHERLSRLHDPGRGDLGPVLAHRLAHASDHPRFVRGVLRRSSRRGRVRRWPLLPLAAAALLVLSLGWWALRPAPDPRWISGPASVALAGGGTAELEPGARWRNEATPFLERGKVSLEVAPRSAAPFVLRTPQASITVLGTRFRVEVDEDTAVAVQRGRVRLEGATGTPIELTAGGRGRCAGGAPRSERILFASGFAADEPATILTGSTSPRDPSERPDPCVAAGVYVADEGPRVAVAVSIPQTGFLRYEPGLQVHFRWWGEPALGAVQLLVWDMDQQRNYHVTLEPADGTWQQVSLPFARLQPFAGLPRPELRAQPGDRLQGVTVIGSSAKGRLYLDDLAFSVSE